MKILKTKNRDKCPIDGEPIDYFKCECGSGFDNCPYCGNTWTTWKNPEVVKNFTVRCKHGKK